ncbi:MAG: hypothetical protein NUV82_01315 [Candidatus Komeilibacteria bacterium]|nr:hypothetical protein [Candidatus Komeilibacteria bacterium]
MTKKFQVGFGGGSDTIFFSLVEKVFMCYESDHSKLHQKFGGEKYYESRSGSSGSGYLEKIGDLVEFGFYRTDARREQTVPQTVCITDKGTKIYGYAPFISHGGIDLRNPVVLTDGKHIVFFSPESGEDIMEMLSDWDNKWYLIRTAIKSTEVHLIGSKEVVVDFITSTGGWDRRSYYFYNPHHLQGVDILRFVDTQYMKDSAEKLREKAAEVGKQGRSSLLERKLGITLGVDYEGKSAWYKAHKEGFYDGKIEEEPHSIQDPEILGWNNSGDGLYWRRKGLGLKVEAFMEVERVSIGKGKYVVSEETPHWLDYEGEFSLIDWHLKPIDAWKEFFLTKLTQKARQDYITARSRVGTDALELMEKKPDAKICIQDSLDAGNCLPGTEDFIRRFNIKPDENGCATVQSLIENPSIAEMLRNFDFKKIIYQKLAGENA